MPQYPSSAVNPFRLVTKADTAGAVTLGAVTAVADAVTSDMYGSWAQILASTSAESYITELAITISNSNAPVLADAPITLQLGVGGAGSEAVRFERLMPLTTYVSRHVYLIRLDVPLRITASKRVAARIKCATTSTVALGVNLYGLPVSQTEGN